LDAPRAGARLQAVDFSPKNLHTHNTTKGQVNGDKMQKKAKAPAPYMVYTNIYIFQPSVTTRSVIDKLQRGSNPKRIAQGAAQIILIIKIPELIIFFSHERTEVLGGVILKPPQHRLFNYFLDF